MIIKNQQEILKEFNQLKFNKDNKLNQIFKYSNQLNINKIQTLFKITTSNNIIKLLIKIKLLWIFRKYSMILKNNNKALKYKLLITSLKI